MRVLMIGDVVGRPGRKAVQLGLADLKKEYDFSLIVANGENSSGGFGISGETAAELFSYGVDILTTGNHIWNKREAFALLEKDKRVIRPANYPPMLPGSGLVIFETKENYKIAVLNLSGRSFMPALDCPFRMVDEMLKGLQGKVNAIVVDFHAEATSEKLAFGWHLAGRVAAVCGTHTHVQTADERILPGGTAYITDMGMSGPRDSVIGTNADIAIRRFITQAPVRMEVASGLFQFNGVIIEIDETCGEALSIDRVQQFE